MFTIYEQKNEINVTILHKVDKVEYQANPLLQIHFEKHPIAQPQLFYSLKVYLQQIQFIYYPLHMKRLLDYFQLQQRDDYQKVIFPQLARNINDQSVRLAPAPPPPTGTRYAQTPAGTRHAQTPSLSLLRTLSLSVGLA